MSLSQSWKPSTAWAVLAAAEPPEWVLQHTRCVAGLARAMANEAVDQDLDADIQLTTIGAVLHDYGRAFTQGIDHASLGAQKLRDLGIPEPVVLIVERHTGGGIDKKEAKALGLPAKDYTPKTIEERIVCHADNLYSGEKRLALEQLRGKYMTKGLNEAWRKIHALHDQLCRELDTDLESLEPVEITGLD